ncbi:LysE family translocator [Cryptosporangium sp. NPDC051539]|uniref:LysE family translocator n=1 Tax=Cryptosporangium sp. NPDC051539 TaxID=3363962 RepID=UPI0037B40A83
MSVISALVSFALVAALLTIVPGLDTTYVLRTAIVSGRRAAFAAATGIGTGALAWGVAAAVGVSALLTASTIAYTALRVAGASYLLWLGVQLIRATLGKHRAEAETDDDRRATAWQAWRRGVLTNLLNPKVGAFYLAVIPQFLPEGAPHLVMGVALALVHNAEGMVWFSALILAAHGVRGWLRRPSVRHAIDRVTGTALIAVGLKVALTPG